jgi:hypothetical protein
MLRDLEGFELLSSGNWSGSANVNAPSTGRFSGQAWQTNSGTLSQTFDNQPTWIFGMAQNIAGAAVTAELIGFRDGSTLQVGVFQVPETGPYWHLEVRNGLGTVLATSASLPNLFSTWNYIEFKATIHASAGSFEARVNNVTVLSGSGVRTNANANNYASIIRIGFQNFTLCDDVYVCDGTGSTHNDFLQDSKVQTFVPSADGANTDFTPNSGSNHFSRLATNDGDTSYLSSGVLNALDTFDITPGTITGTIQGVKVSVVARKDDVGSRAVAIVLTDGLTTVVEGDNVLTATYNRFEKLLEENPVTTDPWVAADLTDLEFGFKVTV